MILLELFISFFQVGLFSFGGGMAAIPFIQEQVVNVHAWMSLSEFSDLVSISQMTPGPIAINSATFVGTRVAGLPGAIVATLGNIAPSCIIISILAYFYFKYSNLRIMQGILAGLRPSVVALIASAGVSIFIVAIWGTQKLGIHNIDFIAFGLFIVSLLLLRKKKMDPIFVLLICGVLGGLFYR